jgi:hypothetical protein
MFCSITFQRARTSFASCAWRKSEKLRLTRAYTGWYTDTDLIKAGEANCRVERLRSKTESTKAMVITEDGRTRITQVMIKGKRAMYLF